MFKHKSKSECTATAISLQTLLLSELIAKFIEKEHQFLRIGDKKISLCIIGISKYIFENSTHNSKDVIIVANELQAEKL